MLLPVDILAAGEICLRTGCSLACRQHLHLVLLHGKLAHGLIGGFVVQIPEAMDADDVKGVAHLQVRRVFGMVAVNKLILLDLYASHTGGCNQMPAALVIGRLIHIREKCLQRLADRIIGTVEQTHDTFLGQRVLHLLLCSGIRLALPGGGWKPCGICPFRMFTEYCIWVKPRSVRLLIHEGTVGRRGRPVHQLIRLIGAFVKIVNTQHLSKIAGDRHKFLRGHIPGQREHQPDTWIFFRAAVGGVQHRGIGTE